ncbi:MAG TPA: hypothetical protein VGJ15_04150 [Pirellulales bacterium]|jgi:hypothetical protein
MSHPKTFCIIGVALAAIAISLTSIKPIAADEPAKKTGENKPAANKPVSTVDDKPEVVQFTLHPASVPYAPLKYQFLPRYFDQVPGNAAPLYMRAAIAWLDDKDYQRVADKIADWNELPLDQFRDNKELQDYFNSTPTGHWDLIRMAAHRETCDWALPLRETNIATMMPELQQVRSLARLIAFKARMEISRGEIDKAIETLQTGFTIGRHAAQGQTLVNALVGVSICMQMLHQVESLVQQPHCPNLYWTLTSLPRPMIDMHTALGAEQDFVYLYMPELKDIRTATHTPAEWDLMLLAVTKKFMAAVSDISSPPKSDWENFGVGAYYAVTAYPKALVQLKAAGYSQSEIKEMPMSQAVLLATVETYDHLRDELNKWLYLPLGETLLGIEQFQNEMAHTDECIPLARALLPSLQNVKAAEARLARQVEAVRVLEALRLYAADHNGELPKSLSDIKAVPIPSDDVTGKPFEYELHHGYATLTSPAPFNVPGDHTLHWEIKMEPVKKK